jgi:hypothetical protein
VQSGGITATLMPKIKSMLIIRLALRSHERRSPAIFDAGFRSRCDKSNRFGDEATARAADQEVPRTAGRQERADRRREDLGSDSSVPQSSVSPRQPFFGCGNSTKFRVRV